MFALNINPMKYGYKKFKHPEPRLKHIYKNQFKVGTILEDPYGRRRTILAIKDGKYQLSHKGTHTVEGKWWTAQEIFNMGDRIAGRET